MTKPHHLVNEMYLTLHCVVIYCYFAVIIAKCTNIHNVYVFIHTGGRVCAPAQTARGRLLFVCWQANSAFNKRLRSRVDVARDRTVLTPRPHSRLVLSRTSAKFSAYFKYFSSSAQHFGVQCCSWRGPPCVRSPEFFRLLKLLDRICARRYVFFAVFVVNKHSGENA